MKKGRKRIYAEGNFYIWLAVAAMLHVFVLFAAVFLQIRDEGWHVKPKIVSVTLVSLSGSEGSQKLPEVTGLAKAIPAKPVSSPVAKQSLQPSIAKKSPAADKAVHSPAERKTFQQSQPSRVGAKKSPEPKSADRQEMINTALDRIKQSVGSKTPPPPSSMSTLNSAFAQLQQKLKSEEAPPGGVNGRGNVSSGKSGAGKGYGGGGTSYTYKAEIASIIQKNWEFSRIFLKNSEGMEAYVRINIHSDGMVDQILFDKRAASEYFNNSVKKAIEKSSPLPVPPRDDAIGEAWIGFVFTPAGIEKSGK